MAAYERRRMDPFGSMRSVTSSSAARRDMSTFRDRLGLAGALPLLLASVVGLAAPSSAGSAVQTQTFKVVADAYVRSNAKHTNYGSSATLYATRSPVQRSYLRFNVGGTTGTVSKATLRLYVRGASTSGFTIGTTTGAWSEGGVTYANAPTSTTFTTVPAYTSSNTWRNVDVTKAVKGNGSISFVLGSSGSASFYSREANGAAFAPELVVETQTTVPEPPPPPPPPTSGATWSYGFGTWSSLGKLWPAGSDKWRPFAASSPFNMAVPANVRLDPSSAAIAARISAWASGQNYAPGNLATQPSSGQDYDHPYYFAAATDTRQLTIHCTRYACSEIEGRRVRVPNGALPADGSDAHVAIVDGTTIIDLWEASSPPASGTWNVGSGGMSRLDGSGLVADANGDGTVGSGQATAARWSLLAGMLRGQDLAAGIIQHGLFGVVKCVNGKVWPALAQGRQCSAIGESMTNAPRLGDWLYLALTDAEIDALRYTNGTPLHPSMRVILRAMARYGIHIGDTGGYELTKAESYRMYSSMGTVSPLHQRGVAENWATYGAARVLRFRDLPTWVWTERLRVIHPCVAAGTC